MLYQVDDGHARALSERQSLIAVPVIPSTGSNFPVLSSESLRTRSALSLSFQVLSFFPTHTSINSAIDMIQIGSLLVPVCIDLFYSFSSSLHNRLIYSAECVYMVERNRAALRAT